MKPSEFAMAAGFGSTITGATAILCSQLIACATTEQPAVAPDPREDVWIGNVASASYPVYRIPDSERGVECYVVIGRTGSGVSIWCHAVKAEAETP